MLVLLLLIAIAQSPRWEALLLSWTTSEHSTRPDRAATIEFEIQDLSHPIVLRHALRGAGRATVSEKTGGHGVRPDGVWSGSGLWKLDVLECEDFGELVEVGVAVK